MAWTIALLLLGGLAGISRWYDARGVPLPPGKKDVIAIAQGKELLVVGDSRAETGIAPAILAQVLGIATFGNMANEGTSPINQLELLRMMGEKPRCVVVAVSPASVYGTFYVPPFAVRRMVEIHEDPGPSIGKVIKTPFDCTEKVLSAFARRHLAFGDGFRALAVAMTTGRYPQCRTPEGWDQVIDLGERVAFLKLVNMEAYRSLIFKPPLDFAGRDKVLGEALRGMTKTSSMVLVRLPCAPVIRRVEDENVADFDERMNAIARSVGLVYLHDLPGFLPDWTDGDGSHLLAPDARRFSGLLAREMQRRGIPTRRSQRSSSMVCIPPHDRR